MPEWMGSLCATRRPGEDVGCVLRDVLAVEDESRGRHGGERQVGGQLLDHVGDEVVASVPFSAQAKPCSRRHARGPGSAPSSRERSIKVESSLFRERFCCAEASAAAQISERISRKSDSRQIVGVRRGRRERVSEHAHSGTGRSEIDRARFASGPLTGVGARFDLSHAGTHTNPQSPRSAHMPGTGS